MGEMRQVPGRDVRPGPVRYAPRIIECRACRSQAMATPSTAHWTGWKWTLSVLGWLCPTCAGKVWL